MQFNHKPVVGPATITIPKEFSNPISEGRSLTVESFGIFGGSGDSGLRLVTLNFGVTGNVQAVSVSLSPKDALQLAEDITKQADANVHSGKTP